MTPTTVGGCYVQFVFHSSLINWKDNAAKLYIFLDDSVLCYLVSMLLTIFTSPVYSSPVQSSPAIVDVQLHP